MRFFQDNANNKNVHCLSICILQLQGEGAGRLTGKMYRGVTGTLYTIAKTEGPKAWYSGLSAGLQRQMCFASIRIGLYDTMKQFYMQQFSGKYRSPPKCFGFKRNIRTVNYI